ncbi:XRE family transcriptional regulator [Listeria monocytogenes]|nr:XRE family transcriptional regulator [Listeria monocytogenes]
MEINQRIINLREKKNWSQRELADRIGINKAVMNRIEMGERDIRAHELEALANVFNVSTDYLLGRDDNSDLLAAHIDDDVTEEEMIEIEKFIKYLKSQRDE